MVIAGTGHRPERIRIGSLDAYDPSVFGRMIDLAAAALVREKPDLVIAGGALGFDEALARAAIRVAVPFALYLPFPGYDGRWPAATRERYRELYPLAAEIRYVTPEDELPRSSETLRAVRPTRGAAAELLHRRNRAMVDAADVIIALWDGAQKGGTWQCLRYAEFKGRTVRQLWPAWKRHAGRGNVSAVRNPGARSR